MGIAQPNMTKLEKFWGYQHAFRYKKYQSC